MNWKALVEKQNAKTFVLPAGWDSRDQVAEQLGCSPEKVADHLRACINAKTVEKREFVVWDRDLSQKVRVTAYRQVKAGAGLEASTPTGEWTEEELKKAWALKAANKTNAQIGAALGRSKDAVRARLNRQRQA